MIVSTKQLTPFPEPFLKAAEALAWKVGADAREGDLLTIGSRPGGHTVEIAFKNKPVRVLLFVPEEK